MATDADALLLASWAAGDPEAGRALFARYYELLHRFFATKCDEPEELIQLTFLALLRARHQFAGRSSFRTYAYCVARNELYTYLRTLRRTREFDPDLSSIADLTTTPGRKLARNEEHRQMLEALRQLPVEQQSLLELHYWEELGFAELAEVFDVSQGAIRTRLTRARAALREQLRSTATFGSDDELDTWARRAPR